MTRLSITDRTGREVQIMYADKAQADVAKELAEANGCSVKVLGMAK